MLKRIAIFALAILCTQSPAKSDSQISDKVILKVHVYESGSTAPETQSFTLEDLKKLPTTSVSTNTIWTEGEQIFTGVKVQSLLEYLDVQSGQLELIAKNEYSIDVPVEDFYQDAALLAYDRNGKTMSVREHGPLWLVFDYDSNAKYRTEFYYLRSIWQLHEIRINSNYDQ